MVVPSLMMTACAVGFFLLLFLPFVMVPTALAGGVGWGLYRAVARGGRCEETTRNNVKEEEDQRSQLRPRMDVTRRRSTATETTAEKKKMIDENTAPPPPAKVPLTGSAALMANMRRSTANTGEKRTKILPTSSRKDTSADTNGSTTTTTTKATKETTKETNSNKDPKSEQTFYVLHGGEAAQQVARDLKEAMEKEFFMKHGMKARDVRVTMASMEDFKKTLELQNSNNSENSTKRRAIFVVETVENAQPAEEAGSCIRYFNKMRKKLSSEDGDKTVPPFDENTFQYAVMGLGDTNLLLDRQTTTAKDCNQAAQTLDNALAALGAHRLCEKGLANDAIGLEEGVLPWLEKRLLPNVLKAVKEEKARAERNKPIEVVFAYGSQTGNAAEICKNLAAEATERYKKDKMTTTTRIECFACNELDAETSLKPGTVVLFCISSTGDGDAPDNCDMFLTRLKRRVKKTTASDPVLAGTQYAVLGLGDQNYSAFMTVPRMFSTIMEKGGATMYKKRLEADDTLGLYEQVDAWVDTLWVDLDQAISRAKSARENPKSFLNSNSKGVDDKDATTTTMTTSTTTTDASANEARDHSNSAVSSSYKGIPALQPARVKISFSNNKPTGNPPSPVQIRKDMLATRESPFYAKIASKKILTNTLSDRRVVHLEFDCENKNDSIENYEPGDSLAVLPKNDSALVSELMSRLGEADETKTFDLEWIEGMAPPGSDDVSMTTKPLPHVITPCTVRDALEKYIDITSVPRKSFLRALAECCTNDEEKDRLLFLSSRDGKERFRTDITDERPTLLTLLRTYPSCSISLERLLDISSPLLPRMYSITSCKDSQKNPSVAFSVVKYETPENKETRLGVATNWLDGLPLDHEDIKIPIYKVPTKTFGLPEDISKPIIMIGPGTGVAPFRGFLQKREALARANPSLRFAESWLFFGCRRKDEDYLYEADFNAFVENKTLTRLVSAFSREDPSGKKVYVQHKLAEHEEKMRDLILREKAYVFVCGDGAHMAKDVHKTLLSIVNSGTGEENEEILRDMTREGRYVRDIWS